MTERELFYGFYRLAREESRMIIELEILELAMIASRAGLSDAQIIYARAAAIHATRNVQAFEPSRNSVCIQMLMHTFGRVRRGA